MEGKTTLNLEIKMEELECIGAGLRGYLYNATYDELVKVFSKPQFHYRPGDKMQIEWTGKINGEVFSIYDYKTEKPFKKNTEWNIGARKKIAAELVKIYFELNK